MIFLLFFFLFLQNAQSAKVLFTAMDQGRSHVTSITPLIHRFQKYNHSTALYINIFQNEMDFGVDERYINMSGLTNHFLSSDFFSIAFNSEPNFVHLLFPFTFGSFSCNDVLQSKRDRFFEIANEDWDLFLCDSLFTTCGYGMADISEKHHVMMHSSDVESAQGSFKGYSRNYAILVPNFLPYSMTDFSIENFLHRALSTIDWFGGMIILSGPVSLIHKWALRSIVGFPYFSFYEFIRKSTFSFTDMPDQLYPVGPRTNDYFSFGTYCKPAKSFENMDKKFINFIEDPKSKGTILIAFGTIIDWRFAPKEKVQIFIEVVNKLVDYRVIWSMKGDRPVGLKDHVMTSAWVPQNQILHHNNTKLFISHGGLKSVKEAGCSSTPSLFMPMFAEQMRNAWLAKNKGFAEILNKFLLSEIYFEEQIIKILENLKYQQNAQKYSLVFLDRPMQNLDEAAFKLNKLIKYNGKMPEYFYPKAIDLSYITSLNLDFLLLIPIFLFYILCR